MLGPFPTPQDTLRHLPPPTEAESDFPVLERIGLLAVLGAREDPCDDKTPWIRIWALTRTLLRQTATAQDWRGAYDGTLAAPRPALVPPSGATPAPQTTRSAIPADGGHNASVEEQEQRQTGPTGPTTDTAIPPHRSTTNTVHGARMEDVVAAEQEETR